MSDYGSVDDIKKKIRDKVYSTELKDWKDRIVFMIIFMIIA